MLNLMKKIKPIALLMYVFSSVLIADDSFDIQFSDISMKTPAGSMSLTCLQVNPISHFELARTLMMVIEYSFQI